MTDRPDTTRRIEMVIDRWQHDGVDAALALESPGFGRQATIDDVVAGVEAFGPDRGLSVGGG